MGSNPISALIPQSRVMVTLEAGRFVKNGRP